MMTSEEREELQHTQAQADRALRVVKETQGELRRTSTAALHHALEVSAQSQRAAMIGRWALMIASIALALAILALVVSGSAVVVTMEEVYDEPCE